MKVVILYILMVIFLTWVMVWSQKKGGYDTTVGGLIFYAFCAAIPGFGLFMAMYFLLFRVMMRKDVKTFFSKTIVEGD